MEIKSYELVSLDEGVKKDDKKEDGDNYDFDSRSMKTGSNILTIIYTRMHMKKMLKHIYEDTHIFLP